MTDMARPDGSPDVVFVGDLLDQAFGAGTTQVICPIADPFVRHHGALGDLIRVHRLAVAPPIQTIIAALQQEPRLLDVLPGSEACRRYDLAEAMEGDAAGCGLARRAAGPAQLRHLRRRTERSAAMTRRAIVVVLDGLRRDTIDPATTPALERLATSATRFDAHRSVFPSATRCVSASFATGCYPARHGLQGNAVALMTDTGLALHDVGRPDFMDQWRQVRGQTLAVPTLAERLAQAGQQTMLFSNVSPPPVRRGRMTPTSDGPYPGLWGGIQDSELDRLILSAAGQIDGATREKLDSAAMQRTIDQNYFMAICHAHTADGVRRKVQGFTPGFIYSLHGPDYGVSGVTIEA